MLHWLRVFALTTRTGLLTEPGVGWLCFYNTRFFFITGNSAFETQYQLEKAVTLPFTGDLCCFVLVWI